MEIKYEITHEDAEFFYGMSYHRADENAEWRPASKFMQLKETLWFCKEPRAILQQLGITTDARRAQELAYFFDGNLSGYYYVSVASDGTDEAIKWILGGLAAHLNETGQSVTRINQILPATRLRAFVDAQQANRFPRSFAKDVFAKLLEKGSQYPEDAEAVLNDILADPRFKVADDSAIDAIIEAVIAANPDQVAKAAENPKVVQWFVGQVMKAAKGQAPAPVVLAKLTERLAA